MYAVGGQNDHQHRITCEKLVLAHGLPCVLYQPHAMGVMELYGGGVGIEGLHCGLHSDYIVIRESTFGPLWRVVVFLLKWYISSQSLRYNKLAFKEPGGLYLQKELSNLQNDNPPPSNPF